MSDVFRKIATHDGAFHGDDVLAVAILARLYRNYEIIRTREQELIDQADLAVDVGGVYDHVRGRYDHHMPSPPVDRTGHVYSSVGLVWKNYGKAYLKAIGVPEYHRVHGTDVDIHDEVDKIIKTRWIYPIDRSDNGVATGPTPISDLVSAMHPIDAEKSRERYDSLFLEAVSLVGKLFYRACFHAVDQCLSRIRYSLGEKTFYADNRIMVSTHEVKIFGGFTESDIHFVIFPVEDFLEGGAYYVVRPIYIPASKFYKTPFPQELLGVDQKGSLIKAIPGLNFVHHSGFMARFVDEASALAFCRKLLED